jgi:polynucleotide 5'-hydroxyl-kinase GRC3/NOL9
MSSEPGRALALERAAAARVILILGDTDTGKTTLTAALASGLAARGLPVGVIDADLGQSQIGPPAALGLGGVRAPIAALAEAELLALAWVGRTSPPGLEEALWAGAARLVDRAAALGLRPVLVDTGGLVLGRLGRRLAVGTVRRLAPDLIVCLERAGECEPILAEIAGRSPNDDPEILRLPVAPAVRRRTSHERRGHRERAFEAYFAEARVRDLPLGCLEADGRGDAVDRVRVPGALLGLLGPGGETLGLGRIVDVEPARDRIVVETPVREPVARALVGGERLAPPSRHQMTRHEVNA